MKRKILLSLSFLSAFTLFGCNSNVPVNSSLSPTSNTTTNSVIPTQKNSTTNNQNVNVKNDDIVSLSRDLDNLESLEKLTGVSSKSLKSMLLSSSEEEKDEEGYVDVTNPPSWYYGSQSGVPSYLHDFNEFFNTNSKFYSNAVAVKNEIINVGIPYLNMWYEKDNNKYRITYDEELNDMFLEKINGTNRYMKVNVGIDENNKLYYSYISSRYDDLNVFGGIVHQDYIEYKEDEYYNSYQIDRQKSGVIHNDGTSLNFYEIVSIFQEVDLSIPGGRFYSYSDWDYYEKNSLKKYNQNRDRELGEDEEDDDNNVLYVFWVEGGNLVNYRMTKNFNGFSMCRKNGIDVMDLTYNAGDSWEENKYSGFLNMYEMSGIKDIKNKETIELEKVHEGAYNYYIDYKIEFENGQKMVSSSRDYMEKYSISNWGSTNGTTTMFYPMFTYKNLSSMGELALKLDELGIQFKNFDFSKYVDLYDNIEKFEYRGYSLIPDNFKAIENYFLTKKALIDIPTVSLDYENVEELKIPFEIKIAYEVIGTAVIYDDYIDLSNVNIKILNIDSLNEKDLKKLDVYYNDSKVTKLDFNLEDGTFSFNEQKHVDLNKNKYETDESETLKIKISKLGFYIEIPFVKG